MKHITALMAIGVVSTAAVQASQASMIGDQADFNFVSPGTPQFNESALGVTVVDPGVEFSISVGIDVDVKAESITLTAFDDSDFFLPEHLIISGLDWVNDPNGKITGFTTSGGFTGFFDSPGGVPNVSILDGGHTVRIDFDSVSPDTLGFTTGDVFTIDLITDDVPEPMSLALLGIGGLALLQRRIG